MRCATWLGNPPHFFLLVQSVRVDTFHCAFAGRRKLHIHFSTLPFPAASQACGWGIWGGAWRQKPHAAFRRRAGAPSPYPLPASSYSKRKSSLRLEPEHAKGGCGPPFGIPQRLTLAVKSPWHYRAGTHPPDASLTCGWVRKNEEADTEFSRLRGNGV